jgi:catechol 2,3-dioxygenase
MVGLRDAEIEIGAVALAVADLERSLDFYRRAIGMDVLGTDGGSASLGVGGRELLRLEERPGARLDDEAAGLFHYALLLPSRAALGAHLAHMLAADVPLTGAADHHVSEALYLDDPDGHGIELYRDRPRDHWQVGGAIRLTTERLDHAGLLAAGRAGGSATGSSWDGLDPGTVMGHVHLETADLEGSRRFYTEQLGLDVTATIPHAVFMSTAGYHHHLAINDWRHKRRPATPDTGGIGLLWYQIRVSATDLPSDLAVHPADDGGGGVELRDPVGVPIRLTLA